MIRGVTFLEGDILYSFTISVHLISGMIRGVTFLNVPLKRGHPSYHARYQMH
jgi:hypothetical protein